MYQTTRNVALLRARSQTAKVQLRNVAVILCVLALMLAAGACGGQKPAQENSNVHIMLIPAPEGKDGQYLTIKLADAGGQPITDASVSLEGNMNHAGMVPVTTDSVKDDADGAADGAYRVPFQFSMLGDWIITVSAKLADGTTIKQDINATVTGEGVAVAGAPATDELTVTNAMAHPAPTAGGNGAVYLTIMNSTDQADKLVGVASPSAQSAELHESIDDNGVIKMLPRPEGFDIPAGGSVELKPGGKHIMLVGLAKPLAAGDTVEVTLKFEHAAPIVLNVPVMAMDGQ